METLGLSSLWKLSESGAVFMPVFTEPQENMDPEVQTSDILSDKHAGRKPN